MKPEKRRQQILECAKKLFSINGYYSTQISDIIREADIARGTVYQYFSNKDDIFITLLEDYYQKWQAMMTSWAERVPLATISPREYLRERIL
ncbi:MAG: TetR/AcrR family transcriptional regulator, partial [Desulfatibacillaceae bacterium]|nr:TetR/AcrR family transcriptional regulator [Desulfatibacillaceae bacterium]